MPSVAEAAWNGATRAKTKEAVFSLIYRIEVQTCRTAR